MKAIQKERGSVYTQKDAWKTLHFEIETISPSKIIILVDFNTKMHCLPLFLKQFSSKKKVEILEIQAGEKNKTIETCSLLWKNLTQLGADRNSVLINLGGGMITDLGGFVASTFKRGIEFFHVPTTLLAMIDAAVGGKNGVDLGSIKNQIGVINAPKFTLIDTKFLNTLPTSEIQSGYAEMLKHGLIHSKKYWTKAQSFSLKNAQTTQDLIWESICIKNEIVEKDPFEKGKRKTLNFGHTLGHAIESFCLESSNKKELLHGEAVAIGMILVCYISTKLLSLPKKICDEISQVILSNFLKVSFTNYDIKQIIKLLIFDKKNINGKVLFVLLNKIGDCSINCEVPEKYILEAFAYYENL